jgi:hypothetical protein
MQQGNKPLRQSAPPNSQPGSQPKNIYNTSYSTKKNVLQMTEIPRTAHMIDSPSVEHDMNPFTTASENEPMPPDRSPSEDILSDTDEDDIPLITLYRARRKQHPKSRSRQRPNLPKIFPLEIIFLILDFMTPDEYSGFACTCRDALSLVNQKLVASEPCYYNGLVPWTSRTGDYIRIQASIQDFQSEWMDYGRWPAHNYPDPDENDSDL